MSGMAEVLRKELAKGGYQMPGDTLPYETQAARIAAALTTAGFGDVREQAAKLEAVRAVEHNLEGAAHWADRRIAADIRAAITATEGA